MGRWLIIIGASLLFLGVIVQFAPWLVSWFGKLPGDIRIESERGKISIPITSMLIVSIVITLLINLFKR
ncbi:MAG: DUF2905 domain-containing protein [Nitrosomonas sp.]|nr:DUF2905 domain-containing protein [Nitrosomonas sp.]MBK7365718.1 DUF2905 domain-containing protein [Nitrosomonas sp.]